MGKPLGANYPALTFQKALVPDAYDADKIYSAIVNLVTQLSRMQNVIAQIVSFNSVKEFSGDAAPSPNEGELYVWKDADASSGQPTHYLVYNMAGTTVTFASEETVP